MALLRGVAAAMRSRRQSRRTDKPARPTWQMLLAALAGFVLGVVTMIALSYLAKTRV